MRIAGRVLALSGGVGGAKLALGLSHVMPPEQLLVIANTGDDFTHLGLHVSPDIDTLTYALGGVDNQELGWGQRDETWSFMQALHRLGGETWFQLGDRDLATHVERTRRLAAGETLSTITNDFARSLGIKATIAPMSDQPVRTRLRTADGWLDFQDYFVRQQCRPVISRIAFEGADSARPLPLFLAALSDPALRAVVVCPSNPFISVDPILALPEVRIALAACRAPVVAINPIIGGRAVKGPTAKMLAELGFDTSAVAVSRHYHGLVDIMLIDEADAERAGDHGMATIVTRTLMTSLDDRIALARQALTAADTIRERKASAMGDTP